MIDPKRLDRTHVINVRGQGTQFFVILYSPPLFANGHRVRDAETFSVTWDQWVIAKANADSL